MRILIGGNNLTFVVRSTQARCTKKKKKNRVKLESLSINISYFVSTNGGSKGKNTSYHLKFSGDRKLKHYVLMYVPNYTNSVVIK